MRDYAHIKSMNMIVIIVVVMLVIAFITLSVVIYSIRSGEKKRRRQYQNQSKSVLVKNGMDVKKQVLGDEKGDYFTGNLEKQGTYYVNPAVTVWRIAFDNLITGQRILMDFTRQMWIGRSGAGWNQAAKMILSGDEKISRNHCTIYESGGVLCLQDLDSSNHTYLNGKIITNAVYLQNGDVICIGDTQLRVQYSIVNNRPT